MTKRKYIQPQSAAITLRVARGLMQTSYDLDDAKDASQYENPPVDVKEHQSIWDQGW
jgi:hypothetical protein